MVNKITNPITPLGVINKINEIIDNTPTTTEEIYIAIYGTTTFNDILAAYLAGKTILCEYNYSSTTKMYLYLVEVGGLSSNTAQSFVFSKIENQVENVAVCYISNAWSYTSTGLQSLSQKVTSISSSSTDTQYPSAKCVYDEINTVKRNIGEIVTSTIPLTDAGLHLLDGSLLAYGSYQSFIDYIANLYTSGNYSAIFTTEANWQSAVTTYGVCGKFVYDSTNNTVRLPKITGITEGTTDLTALGDLVQAGLPNITGSITYAYVHKNYHTNGAISFATLSNVASSLGSDSRYGTLSFDASNSNSIYGNSNTVQPQTIKVLYYIVVGTSTKTDIQVDIDEIATDLNGKADTDLSNLTSTSSTNFDGQWVAITNDQIFTGQSLTGSTDLTYDLSSFLPSDNYDYEVMLVGFILSGSTSGNYLDLSVYSDIVTGEVRICGEKSQASNSGRAMGTIILPINVNRKLYVKRDSGYSGSAALRIIGYRRIGTNQ